jgi:uncharacterized protein (DUF697 family)
MTTNLTVPEQEALLTVALMAAFADGGKSEVERAEVKRIAEGLPQGNLNPSVLFQRVLLRQVSLPEAVAPLASPEARQLAYEIAVCVCESDDSLNEAEKRFLSDARRELRLEGRTVEGIQNQADALVQAPLEPPVIGSVTAASVAPEATAEDDMDRTVLHYSILNGALELLPDSLATMAIVPLQMKMVYGIGKKYGYDLDRRHIGELLGAAGVGLTSQVVEGFARKLLGGLIGKVGGGLGRGVGNQLAGSAMSFASTYALGQLARRYYAGGRQLSGPQLKELFGSLTQQARSLHSRYAGEIQDRARSINPAQLLSLVRGQSGLV